MNKNIVLIGFSGTGKTSAGRLIAEKMQLNYLDIDEEIKKRCSMNIGDIFEQHGESYFRKIEAEIVREFSKAQDYVIATGGGIVLNSTNIDSLKENSFIFWLKGSVETVIDNLKKDSLHMKDRPLLKTENLYQRITHLMHDREQYYSRYYDYEVCIDKMSLMEVADAVVSLLNHDKITSQASFIDFCEQFPEKRLFTFVKHNKRPEYLTGRDLAHKIRILGSALQQELASQEKALLLFDQGLEYIYSLLSCWYANVIAIPISVTNSSSPEKTAEKVNAILSDSQAKGIITNTYFTEFLKTQPAFSAVSILNVDELARARVQDDPANKPARLFAPDDLGLLLYTSGSTSKPKGVMISHQNLMSRALRGGILWDINQASCIVSWMPQFHSFGLDFSILTPLSKGASCIIFSPAGFLENPENWFRLIHQYEATHTNAPNFAFDYCCSTIDITAVQELSLHSLQAIICGGEPVRKETYENFIKKFQSLGLKDTVFCPEYGLSEAGSVTTKKSGQPLHFLTLDIPSLEQGIVKHTKRKNKSKSVTSCGEIEEGVTIRIVHPETGEPCSAEEVGEIWIKCPAVARGYFSLEPETSQTFWGILKNTQEEGFLRTGDLGFIEDNRLYVVGRQKEVIIIHGKNHHPVDIEWTIKKHIPDLILPVAVFACEINNEEKIVVVQEIETPLDEPEYNRLIQRIITAVSENHELEVYEISLVEKNGIPKTGSGKVQRKVCRSSHINQELPVFYRYQHGISGLESAVDKSSAEQNHHILETLKREVFLPLLRIDYYRIEAATSFSELGLDSIQYVRIAKQIETVFKFTFTPVLLFKYRTFEKLAQYLATQTGEPPVRIATQTKPGDNILITPPDSNPRDIAIIGVSGHFPGGAVDSEDFWGNLVDQKDGITSIAESRPLIITEDQKYYKELSDFPPWGGFIEDIDTFDASFFRISPLEAECMDPQQRKLLELTWHVIEDSGYSPSQFADKDVGLFVGVHNNDYSELVVRQPALGDIYGTFLDSGLHMSMVAHRVSRWFNFHGPSEIINTACSSSLVAVHHAVESINRGESSLAIAGGINLILMSRVYRASLAANMLAKDGRCKSFDEQADGFVRAEGYGAVLLKPYAQAVKDKDTIYGIIKRAVINHDGQSNSLRAPNLNAQKQLIKAAYLESGLPLETIRYIEAHGTGTALGDPIEVQALQEAFQEIKADLPEAFCGLGTVKTNIGHCESAAGIAGLVKVLLSMKYGILPGILHFNKLNPYIQLQGSPFYIVEQTQEWKRLKDSEGQEIPLRAGISSFGLGGANAHIVIEEYITANTAPQTPNPINKAKAVIIPVSAKNKECLRVYIRKLHAFLVKSLGEGQNSAHHPGNIDLVEMAYTLQVGREAMEERIVFMAKEIPEFIQQLDAYHQEKEPIKECWQGRVKQGKELIALLGSDEDSQELIHKWVVKGKLDKIAQYWAQGGSIDWDSLYEQTKPRRINLPNYPFAKERYWVPEAGTDSCGSALRNRSNIALNHNPLLQRVAPKETIQLASGIVFETVLTPEHSSVTGHIVDGRPILPEAAYIEMIHAAIKEVTGNISIEIEELDCLEPLVVTGETAVLFILSVIGKNQYGFQILKRGTVPVIYSQGKVKVYEAAADVYIDYQALQKAETLRVDMKQFYERLAQLGIEYKGAFCSLQTMWVGEQEVFGEHKLNDSHRESGYGCHPGLLDCAIQTKYGLSEGMSDIYQVTGMKGVKINADIPSRIYSYLKRSNDGKYYQLALLDPDGKVMIQIQQFQTRKLINPCDELLYLPIWEEQLPESSVRQDQPDTVLIVYSEPSSKFEKTIRDYYQKSKITGNVIQVQLNSQTQQVSAKKWMCDINDPKGFEICLQGYDLINCIYFISECQTEKQVINLDILAQSGLKNEIQLLRLFKVLNQKDPNSQPIDCYVITQDNYRIADTRVNPYGSGITGLAYAIAQGDSRFSVRNIDIASEDLISSENREALLRLILTEGPSSRGEVIKFQRGCRYRRVFRKLDAGRVKVGSGIRKGGVYVILGGSGTIGMVITRYLMQEYNAKVVWIGRQSETSNVIREKIKSFRILGEPPRYIQADVTRLDQMNDAVIKIKRQYSIVNGAMFSGIILDFKKLNQINENEFLDMLNVKTTGSVNFYTAFQDEPLDFMCYFSSIQAFSFTEAVNSAAYASGVTFTDSFVQSIRDTSGFPVGTINWGYWKSSAGNRLFSNIRLLQDGEGIDGFERFTGLLQKNVLHQVACFKASKPEQELMKYKAEEIISIYEKSSDPMIRFLRNYRVEDHKTVVSFENKINDELPKWISKLLFTQMRQLGLLNQNESLKEMAVLCGKAGIIRKYERWIKECFDILESNGYIQCKAGQGNGVYVSVLRNSEPEDIEKVWQDWDLAKESYLQDSDWETQVRLVDACLRKLPEILRGEVPATDILFPNSSIEMVAKVYKGNAVSDYFNTIVADIVTEYVRQRLATDSVAGARPAKVRIIEVGAGTGGTSVMVFAKLKPYLGNVEYIYTDISKAFLLYAEEKYGPDNSYLGYKLWNVDKPLAEQGIDAGGYDVVIATNVLHATKNIRPTIRNTKAALKTNGILLLNEITRKSVLATVTLGLSDGWWLNEDEHLRIPGSPVLYPETWQRLLEEEGFREIYFPAETARVLGQQVILAESDGMARQIVKHNSMEIKAGNIAEEPFTVTEKEAAVHFEVNQKDANRLRRRAIKEVAITTEVSDTQVFDTQVSDESIEEYVKTIILNQLSKSLRVSQNGIDSTMAFSDYGVDSIIGISFIKQVNVELGVSMNTAILFDYTTVNRLTNYIIKTYKEHIQKQLALSSNNALAFEPSFPKNIKSFDDLFTQASLIKEKQNEVSSKTNNNQFIQELEKQFFDYEISLESLIEIALNKDLRNVNHE